MEIKDLKSWKKDKDLLLGLLKKISPASAAVIVSTLVSFFLLQHTDGFWVSVLILAGGAFALCCRRKSLRFVYLIVLCVITCVERHFILHYGDSFNECGSQALITIGITDKEEVLSYIALLKVVEFINLFIFLAAAVMQFPARCTRSSMQKDSDWRSWCAGILSIVCIFAFAGVIAYNPVQEYVRDGIAQKDFLAKRQKFRFHAADRFPDRPSVHFLLIGESHRKDVFDSIVLQGGSPVLTDARKNGYLFEFDDMISYYQQTWFSVFTLLCRRNPGNMETNFGEKGLFSLYQEAGWKVYYITYQPKTMSTTGYDCVINESDVFINARAETGLKRDNSFLKVIDRILKKPEKKILIVMKMSGCHFHYCTRYPQDEPRYCKYQPAYTEEMKKSDYKLEEKERLVNTYCNAMTFSADVFDGIAQRCRDLQIPSFFFFLSDHGIINYDDGKNPFFGAAKSNFHIPCVVYVNEAYRKTMPEDMIAALKKNRTLPVGNDYVFDTIVSLSGLQYPDRREKMDLTSSGAFPAENRKVWVWKELTPYDSLKY